MQLTYPWFLTAIGAVAIPVIIHLLQLRRPQRILFTNTGFIREIELITTKHRKWQHLLILLTRVLGIIALVLMFCQPIIPVGERYNGSVTQEIAVWIDTTPSMQASGLEQEGGFRETVSQAHELGRTVPATTYFRLAGRANTRLTRVAYNAKLDELKISRQGSPSSVAARIIASDLTAQISGPLYMFSDFQKTAFNPKSLVQAGVERDIVLVPQNGKPTGNGYVDSVWIDDAFVRARTNVGLHIRLRNGGSKVVEDCPVKVFLAERQVAAFRVTIAPGQVMSSVVQVQLASGELAEGRVEMQDVPVTFDNTYYFTLQPAAQIRVLEIGTMPVAQALYGNEPLFNFSFAKPQQLNYEALRQANLVLVGEVGKVDAGLRNGLKDVVKRGGSVVVVPSADAASHLSYQALFKELGLGAVQWESIPVGPPELRAVAMPNTNEPFFRDVFGAKQRIVTMPRAAPVLRWSRTGTDILRLRDGESYLAEFASNNGRVYVFSAPFSSAYSDFTSHALFVPVLYRMAMLSYREEQQPAYRLTQGAVNLTLPAVSQVKAGANAASLRLVKDSLVLIPAQRVQGQQVRLDLPTGMEEPGFYQVQRNGKVLTTLAFNQAKSESELAAYSAAELRQLIGPNRPNIRVLEGGVGSGALAKLQAEQTEQPLWRYCLLLALVCLLAEALLLRFGSPRARQAQMVPAT